MNVFTGIGFDAHRLVKGRELILGGVRIPFERGLQGHSDADVLIHAAADALLGAAGLGDIGEHFPDTSPEFKNISSLLILEQVGKKLHANGYRAENIDCVLVMERPRISGYKQSMRENMAKALGLAMERVNIKATTTEGLGFPGRGEGIAAYASANIIKSGRTGSNQEKTNV